MKRLAIYICMSFLFVSAFSCDNTTELDNREPVLGATYNVSDEVYWDPKQWGDIIELRSLSENGTPLLGRYTLPIKQQIPAQWLGCAIGIYTIHNNQSEYQTFFRVVDDSYLLSYEIKREDYNGLPIFRLNGGMSPEFVVQKSLANLSSGISHTWEIGAGGGPKPVWGTVDFVQRSIDKTIGLYDENIGKDTEIENVIIGTGIPVVPYLSATTKAAYLPIHYLVSVNSIKEIQSIVNHSIDNKLPVYATLGYDASMDNVAVAWIKLLDLPAQYKDFITRHKVKNVIIEGVGEDAYGESYVRKYVKSGTPNQEYADGSIYILYTQGGSDTDISHLTSYIKDYDPTMLDQGRMIADWESGVINRQIERIGNAIASSTSANVYSLTSPTDMGCFYNFAVDLSLAFMSKNAAKYPHFNAKGFSFNEYLISHPFYEMLNGYAPILYWQFVPVKNTVDRMYDNGFVKCRKYFPAFDEQNVAIILNGRLYVDDMKAELESRGVRNIYQRVKGVEEVWNLADGENAPCEVVVADIIENFGPKRYREIYSSISPLEPDEIMEIASAVDGVVMNRLK